MSEWSEKIAFMEPKQSVGQKAFAEILNLLDCLKIKYWIEGGWGIDLLLGKQSREHRDVDVDFDSRHTDRLIHSLREVGYSILTDQLPTRVELYHPRLGFLDILHLCSMRTEAPVRPI